MILIADSGSTKTGHWTYPEQGATRMEWLKDKCGK